MPQGSALAIEVLEQAKKLESECDAVEAVAHKETVAEDGTVEVVCRIGDGETIHPGPPYIKVHLFGKRANCMIDTGCSRSVSTSVAISKILGPHWKKHLLPSNIRLKSASGHPLEVMGQIVTQMRFGKVEFEFPLQIVYKKHLSEILLGIDICRATNCVITMKEFVISNNLKDDPKTSAIPIRFYNREEASYQVYIHSDYVIPGGSRRDLVGTLVKKGKSENIDQYLAGLDVCLFNNDSTAESHPLIKFSDSICQISSNNEVSFTVFSNDSEDLILNEGVIDLDVAFEHINYNVMTSEMAKNSVEAVTTLEPDEVEEEVAGLYNEIYGSVGSETVNFISDRDARDAILHGCKPDTQLEPMGYECPPELPKDFNMRKFIDQEVKTPHLSAKQRKQVLDVINEFPEGISKNDLDIGLVKDTLVHIDTGTSPAVFSPYRPVPSGYEEEAEKTIQALLDADIIEPSRSQWASNLICVKKKDGKVRLCVDLRGVNKVCRSTPRIGLIHVEQSYVRIQSANYRSQVDLTQAFHHLKLDDESKQKTAFYGPNSLWQFQRLCYGLKQAPQELFHAMSRILHPLRKIVLYYFDDLLVLSASFEEHLMHLREVLGTLARSGFKLKMSKCNWCLDKNQPLEWLGCRIIRNQLTCDPKKAECFKTMATPKTITEVMRVLGMGNFLRRFVPKYSDIVKGLYDVLKKPEGAEKGALTKKQRNLPLVWTEEAEKSFRGLLEAIANATALMLPNPKWPYYITCDSSDTAAGCMLSQVYIDDSLLIPGEEMCEGIEIAHCDVKVKVNELGKEFDHDVPALEHGVEYPIAFQSKIYNSTEQRYSIPYRELFAICYSLQVFYYLIANSKLVVRTDCRALVFSRKMRELNTQVFRLSLILEELGDFRITHVSACTGNSKNSNAMGVVDFISRAYGESEFKQQRVGYAELMDQRLNALEYPSNLPINTTLSEIYDNVPNYIIKFNKEVLKGVDSKGKPLIEDPTLYSNKRKRFRGSVNQISDSNEEFPEDTFMFTIDKYNKKKARLLEYNNNINNDSDLTNNNKPISETVPEESVSLVTVQPNLFSIEAIRKLQLADQEIGTRIRKIEKEGPKGKYFLEKKVLMKRVKGESDEPYQVIVAPPALAEMVLDFAHGRVQGAHTGHAKLYDYLRKQYYWPRMKETCLEYTNKCLPCLFNSYNNARTVNTAKMRRGMYVNQIVHIDFCSGYEPSKLFKNRYLLTMVCDFSKYAMCIPMKTREADKVAYAINLHWVQVFGPPTMISSDGEFENKVIKHMCAILGTQLKVAPIYNARSNPCEAFNKTINRLLRCQLMAVPHKYWDLYVPFLVAIYNERIHTSIKVSPRSVVMGRVPNMLRPAVLDDDAELTASEWAEHVHAAQSMYWQALRVLRAELDRKDVIKEVGHKFLPGDLVLVRNRQPKKKFMAKTAARFRGPYAVLQTFTNSLLVSTLEVLKVEEHDAVPLDEEEDGGQADVDGADAHDASEPAEDDSSEDEMMVDKETEHIVPARNQSIVPVRDCKLYTLPPEKLVGIDVIRAKAVLKELGVNTSELENASKGTDIPSVQDMGALAEDNLSTEAQAGSEVAIEHSLDDLLPQAVAQPTEGEPKPIKRKVGRPRKADSPADPCLRDAQPDEQLGRTRGKTRFMKGAELLSERAHID